MRGLVGRPVSEERSERVGVYECRRSVRYVSIERFVCKQEQFEDNLVVNGEPVKFYESCGQGLVCERTCAAVF